VRYFEYGGALLRSPQHGACFSTWMNMADLSDAEQQCVKR
jgi:hypothetical protein